MPDDLRTQIERIRQMVDAFNIPRLEMEGFEADDVLGSAARWAATQGLGVKIITGDRDLLQLVDERTIVYLAGDDQNYITPEDVISTSWTCARTRWWITKRSSATSPTTSRVCRAWARRPPRHLLAKYDTLDNIYAHLDEVEPRWRTKLEAGRDSACMSHKLAAIRTDLPVTLDLEQAKPEAFDPARVEGIFRELEFRSLIDKLRS